MFFTFSILNLKIVYSVYCYSSNLNTNLATLTAVILSAWAVLYLSVEEDVDDGVVKGGALGEERRHGHENGSKLSALVGKDVPRNTGVRQPAQQEGDHHNDHDPSDLFLCPLSGL